MTDAEMNIDSIVLNGIWEGQLNVSWLGGLTHSIVDAEESGIVASQRDCMRFACSLDSTTLSLLKRRLFSEYQEEIFESITAFRSDGTEVDSHELTPGIQTPDQLWGMLGETTVIIPPEHRIDDNCCFAVSFSCPWDEEHGVSVLFNKSGIPTDVGGYGDHF